MAGIGQQREGAGEQAADNFDDHEHRNGDEGPRDAALILYAIGVMMTRMAVPGVVVAGMTMARMRVSMRIRMIVFAVVIVMVFVVRHRSGRSLKECNAPL
jgi:hypothetical protein